MEKIISKLVYIPVVGIFIGIFLSLSNKYGDKILNERHSFLWCMTAHLMIPEILALIYVILK